MKLRKVAIISKFGSEESEKASIKVAKIFLGKKITVYTISPSSVPGTKTVEVTEDLKKEKIDLAITLGGDGTTLRAFRGLGNETGTDDGEIVYTVIFLPRKIFATFMDAFSDSSDPNLLMMATLRSFNQNKIFYITLKTVVFWAQKYMGY